MSFAQVSLFDVENYLVIEEDDIEHLNTVFEDEPPMPKTLSRSFGNLSSTARLRFFKHILSNGISSKNKRIKTKRTARI